MTTGPRFGADDDPVAVQFELDEAGPGTEADTDEELDAGARRPVPRWIVRVVLVAAAIVALVVANGPRPPRTPHAAPSPVVPPVVIHPSPVAGSSIEALLVSRRLARMYTVIQGRLAVGDLDGGDDGRFAISSTALGGQVNTARLRLVLNPADDVLWVVPLGSGGSHLLEGFDPRMLRRVARVRLPYPVDGAAVLDGRLYLTYGPELLRVTADRHGLEMAARLVGSGGPLVADPTRHRLLYLDYYNPLSVRSWSPAHGQGAAAALPLTRGQLTVVAGTIWTAGFGPATGVLARLDPRTLRPAAAVAVAPSGPGVVLAAGGERSLLVRSSRDPDRLLCLDGRTGLVTSTWAHQPGVVVAEAGSIVVASPDGRVAAIAAAGCAG